MTITIASGIGSLSWTIRPVTRMPILTGSDRPRQTADPAGDRHRPRARRGIGVVNGFIVTKIRVNSVIATLGVGTIIIGLAFAYSAGVPIVTGVPEASSSSRSGAGCSASRTTSSSWCWCSAGCGWWSSDLDRPGDSGGRRQCGGRAAFRHQGRPGQELGFVISGMCAAVTGMLLASRLGSGTTSAADSYLLTAFAAVFLGSATLRDGEFHVLGTFIGALIIAVGFNGLNIFGAPTFSQYVCRAPS